ncbi:MAG: hypothetical protein JXA99_07455 [Candidatus Lokiarchaeota archaeon]|nr:hypothetical protein [Candidatus Lokiarchaeota archaeon]
MAKGKRTIQFYNENGNLENVIKFLETIQKKINYINLSCVVEGKVIKVKISGPRDLQHLAIERMKDLAEKLLSI